MTKIEWTEATWNPIVGCSIVSPGCTHCYAMRMARRLETIAAAEAGTSRPGPAHYIGTTKVVNGTPVWTGQVARAPERVLLEPLNRRRPTMYFVNSMGDLFHEDVPDEWIDRVFAVMALSPQHTFQLLTKRAARMRDYICGPQTPHRVAQAMDALRADLLATTEEIRAIDGWGGYYVSSLGRVFSDCGSATCVHCGGNVERTARARYCSKKCRQNAQYRMRKGRPMLYQPSLSPMAADAGDDGHLRVMLYRGTEGTKHLVHRLVLATFVRGAIDGEQARHLDGDPSNNALSNLAWGDQSANWDDRKRHGNHRSYAKLTEADVSAIRRRHSAGETGDALARAFSVSATQIRNIARGEQWSVAPPIEWPLPNCWKGISAERQQEADARIPELLATPAAVRFCSAEPLLGPIDFGEIVFPAGTHDALVGRTCFDGGAAEHNNDKLNWVIVGGESGRGARPMHPDWPRAIRDQCAAADVPFFFKQWGEWALTRCEPGGDLGDDMRADRVRFVQPDRAPDGHFRKGDVIMRKVAKRGAGRLLDGREHNAMPGPARDAAWLAPALEPAP